jgi:cellulose synthase/poly-beta-1,6-N-acetylglucosamine synthase-like glycosyltransferase
MRPAAGGQARIIGARDRSIYRDRSQSQRFASEPPAPYSLPFELAALEGIVDSALLEAAARRAERLGIGGDEVVRAHGIVSSDALLEALAARLNLEVDWLEDDVSPPAARLLEAVRASLIRRSGHDHPLTVTVAPRGLGLRRLANALEHKPLLASQLRLTSPERLAAYVRRVARNELAREAAQGLMLRSPEFSAGTRKRFGFARLAVLAGIVATLTILAAADFLFLAIEALLALVFLAWISLRLQACVTAPPPFRLLDVSDRHLPLYTIVIPLYREAHMVKRLIGALERLDYPREKLDIKLIVEADDRETRAAIAGLALGPPFEVIVAPAAGPRTKPKALASALPFARGSFLVVYDAEDEPEAGQLKGALAAFRNGPPELVCVQARLAIDNAADNWLSRQFAAEYAGLFDVFLPALADLRLPLPLGGTSNHFRTDTLRQVGGWDPFNVTEDADLGIRLARFGFHTGVIASTTWEEAPVSFGAWLKQRTRWFKGWLQTWAVHMRQPRRLKRELGWSGFIVFQLLVGGSVLAALVHPFFLALVITDISAGTLVAASPDAIDALHKGVVFTTLFSGYLCSALLALVGLIRRRMLGGAWVLVTIPLYWLILSLAAWRALFQLLIVPYRWEKTEHGFARTSRRAAAARHAA